MGALSSEGVLIVYGTIFNPLTATVIKVLLTYARVIPAGAGAVTTVF